MTRGELGLEIDLYTYGWEHGIDDARHNRKAMPVHHLWTTIHGERGVDVTSFSNYMACYLAGYEWQKRESEKLVDVVSL